MYSGATSGSADVVFPRNERVCDLTLVFDGTQLSAVELENALSSNMPQSLGDRVSVELLTHSVNPILHLRGDVADIDECHEFLSTSLIQPRHLRFYRLEDGAGDYVRTEAYPLIARVERNLRAFVDQAGTSALGFEGWYSFIAHALGSEFVPLADSPSDAVAVSLLERTQFRHLLRLIDQPAQEWESARPVSAEDLLSLLTDASSLEDVRERLHHRLQRRSAWDEVFVKLFQSQQRWNQIKKDLQFVEELRHKVMHHRPIRLGALQPLRKKAHNIYVALVEAGKRLPTVDLSSIASELQSIKAGTPEGWAVSYFVNAGPFDLDLPTVEVVQNVPAWAESVLQVGLGSGSEGDQPSETDVNTQQIRVYREPVERFDDTEVDVISGPSCDSPDGDDPQVRGVDDPCSALG